MSILRSLSWVGVLSLVACNGGGGGSGKSLDSGTDSTDDWLGLRRYTFSEADVEMLLHVPMNAVHGGYLISIASALGDCPSVSEADGLFLVEGGCEGKFGTWSGSAQYTASGTGYDVVYDALSWYTIDGVRYASDGAAVLSTSTDSYSVMVSSSWLEVERPGMPLLVYEDLSTDGMLWPWEAGVGTSGTAAATVSHADGSFSYRYEATEHSDCDIEPGSGQVVAEGDNTVTITFDGSESCDGCVDWQIDDGQSGTWCPVY